MKIIAFLNALAMVDRIIDQLKPAFVAAKSPPPHTVYQELLMASETADEYFSQSSLAWGARPVGFPTPFALSVDSRVDLHGLGLSLTSKRSRIYNSLWRGPHRVSARIAEHGDHRKHLDYSKYKDESTSWQR